MPETEEIALISVQNVRTYSVSVQAMNDVKESLVHLLKTDHEFVKEIFNTALSDSELVKEIFRSAFKTEFESSPKEIELKSISKDEAKNQIQNYVIGNRNT